MNQLLDVIQGFLEPNESSTTPPAKVVVHRQYLVDPSSTRTRTVVQRAMTPYWKERGWRQLKSDYLGNFQTKFGSWQGYIYVSPSGRIEVYIENPPSELEKHPHWPCFRARENGWFFIHATTPVRDVSAGILSTEKTLTEAFQL